MPTKVFSATFLAPSVGVGRAGDHPGLAPAASGADHQAFLYLSSLIFGLTIVALLYGLYRLLWPPKDQLRPQPPPELSLASPMLADRKGKVRAKANWAKVQAHVRRMTGAAAAPKASGDDKAAEAAAALAACEEEATGPEGAQEAQLEALRVQLEAALETSPQAMRQPRKDLDTASTDAGTDTDGESSEDGAGEPGHEAPALPASPKQLLLEAQLRELAAHSRLVAQQRAGPDVVEAESLLAAWAQVLAPPPGGPEEEAPCDATPPPALEEAVEESALPGGRSWIPGAEEEADAEEAEHHVAAPAPQTSGTEKLKDGEEGMAGLSGGASDPQGWLMSLDSCLAQQLTEKDAELDVLYKEVEQLFAETERCVAKVRRPCPAAS